MKFATPLRVLLAAMLLVTTAGGVSVAAPAPSETVESMNDDLPIVEFSPTDSGDDDPWWCDNHKTYEPCPKY